MKIQTGEDLINYFRQTSKAKGKLFFENPNDVENSNGLIAYFKQSYDHELMVECIDRYIDSEREVATTLGKFVTHMGTSIRLIVGRREDRAKFQKLMKETRERMEGQDN